MSIQEKQEALKSIINHYGLDAQMDMMIEECSELIKALLKYRRTKNGANSIFKLGEFRGDIVSEMADVEIMLRQMKVIFDVSDEERDAEIDRKIQRQLQRIEGGG